MALTAQQIQKAMQPFPLADHLVRSQIEYVDKQKKTVYFWYLKMPSILTRMAEISAMTTPAVEWSFHIKFLEYATRQLKDGGTKTYAVAQCRLVVNGQEYDDVGEDEVRDSNDAYVTAVTYAKKRCFANSIGIGLYLYDLPNNLRNYSELAQWLGVELPANIKELDAHAARVAPDRSVGDYRQQQAAPAPAPQAKPAQPAPAPKAQPVSKSLAMDAIKERGGFNPTHKIVKAKRKAGAKGDFVVLALTDGDGKPATANVFSQGFSMLVPFALTPEHLTEDFKDVSARNAYVIAEPNGKGYLEVQSVGEYDAKANNDDDDQSIPF